MEPLSAALVWLGLAALFVSAVFVWPAYKHSRLPSGNVSQSVRIHENTMNGAGSVLNGTVRRSAHVDPGLAGARARQQEILQREAAERKRLEDEGQITSKSSDIRNTAVKSQLNKPSYNQRLRKAEFNPMNPGGGGNSYRPEKRRPASGGG